MAIAASVLLAASVAGNIALLQSHPQSDVISAHIRSLEVNHLVDIPSSEHHTVKPWFNGKLDFAPDVKDIDGFPLIGGRIDYFDGHPAAALVFGRQKHIINLFTWPLVQGAAESARAQSGYHVESWSASGMAYYAVSDLNETELRQFANQYRQR
jgi:anti-sigma factor RsiW